jgi:DNA replication protein DnaC
VLFSLLAERYERGSVMVSSNLAFSGWESIFKDAMMTAAAIDRLVHLPFRTSPGEYPRIARGPWVQRL